MTFAEFKNILKSCSLLIMWDNYTQYTEGDTVSKNNNLYQALADNVNQDPEEAGSIYWKFITENFE